MSEAAGAEKIYAASRLGSRHNIMTSVLLSIFLIRNPNVSSQDDRITVFKNGPGLLVKYYDGHTKKSYDLKMESDDLGSYVKNICRMFNTDTDPFAKMQLNFHGFPTYMMNQDTVTEETLSMLNKVSWMVTDSFFPEEEDEEDYADMPPLIPTQATPAAQAAQRVSACDGSYGCSKPGCYRY
jgi:hypothetical protein